LLIADDFAVFIKDKNYVNIESLIKKNNLSIANKNTIKSVFDMAWYDLIAKYFGLPL